MDVSKLPKLSDTQKEQQAQAAADANQPEPVSTSTRPVVEYGRADDRISMMGGAEAWISLGIGVILLLMNTRFLQYIFARSSFTWTFSDPQGNPLPYTKSVFFWGDLAIVAFAIVLIVEGLVFGFAPKRGLIMIAFVLTIATTVLNFGYVAYMMGGYGLQLQSALAVVFGLYIATYEWKVLKATAPRPVSAI